MKVNNTAIFMGDTTKSQRHEGISQEQKGSKTLFGGNLNGQFDPIAKKRQMARKQAMKIVGDAWGADQKIEKDLAERRARIAAKREEMGVANGELNRIAKEREALRVGYGVKADSQEEEDLRLLERRHDAKAFGKDPAFTDEELERLEALDKNGLTEYQERSMRMYESGDTYKRDVQKLKKEIQGEVFAIKSTKQEMLKHRGMGEAKEKAEELLEQAREEIIGMLMDEAKDHIDEEMQKKVEQAQKKKEEKEEQEERIEKQKEEKEAREEFAEEVSEVVGDMAQMESDMDEIQQEIKKIMEEMKLLQEDLKGAAVDKSM